MDQDFILIEKYLEGELDAKAKEVFLQRMQADSELKARVNLMQHVDAALTDKGALALQQKLETIGASYFNEESIEEEDIEADQKPQARVIPFYRKPLAIAASFLLLVTAAFSVWQMQSASLSSDALYSQYFEPGNLNEMVRGDSTEDIYTTALQQYRNGKFDAAEKSFQQALAKKPGDITLAFGLGQTYLNQTPPKLDEAAKYLKTVIDHKDNAYIQDAAWYLALIQVKQNKIDAAKMNLESVKKYGGELAGKAGKLLKDLGR